MATVLIIDDDLDFCHGLTRIVGRMGHETITSRTLAEGIAAAQSHTVDAIFLDVGLPDGSGLSLLPRIDQLPAHPVVIIITGAGDPDGAALAITSGAWDYIEKGTSAKHIALALRRALDYRRQHQGTLFLDEVGELPAALQKAFLRVLEERRVRPLGSRQEVASDFRLVAATHRDLEQMVARGEFRSDLFFRIQSVSIALAPLRERVTDIRALATHHLHALCRRLQLEQKGISEAFFETLAAYEWPGNVRELVSAQAEEQYLRELLAISQGNLKEALSMSGLSQSRLYALLKKYGLSLARKRGQHYR